MTPLRVSFDDITSYLDRAGWVPAIQGPLAEIWSNEALANSRVMVPRNEQAPDFAALLEGLTREIGRQERRSSEIVREDMARQFIDITKLRAAHAELIEDTIPLDAGAALFSSAYKLVRAAAGSTERRQGHFGHSMPRKATAYAKQMRLGHTMPGSYIVPIISQAKIPKSRLEHDLLAKPHLDLAVEETRHDRRIISTLAGALDVLQEMTVTRDREPSSQEINDSVGEGVSRELCDAITSILDTGEVDRFDVTFNWAPATAPPASLIQEVSFPDLSTEIVKRVAGHLSAAPHREEQILYGIITRLMARRNEESGGVVIETMIDGRLRTVKFDLPWDTYSKAGRYHTGRTPVIVRGILNAPPGRQATMEVLGFGPDRSVMTLDESFDDGDSRPSES